MEIVTDNTQKPTPTAFQELQRQYSETCFKLGESCYKKTLAEGEINKFTNQLRDINQKGFKLQQKLDAETPAQEQEHTPDGQA